MRTSIYNIMNFVGEYDLELPYNIRPKDGWPSPYLSNGKLAIYPRWEVSEGIDNMKRAVLASSFTEREYMSLTDVFNTGRFRIGRRDFRETLYDSREMGLDMYQGAFSRRCTVHDKPWGINAATVQSTIYAPRQYPFCAMQTLNITINPARLREVKTAGEDASGLKVFHGVIPPSQVDAESCRYRFTSTSVGDSNHPVQLFVASGSGVSVTGAQPVCFACAYFWEGDPSRFVFLKDGGNENNHWFEFLIKTEARDVIPLPEDELDEVTMHILTSNLNGPAASEEAARLMVISIATSLSIKGDHKECASKMNDEHIRQWRSMWSSDVMIYESEKGGGAVQNAQVDRARAFQRYIRMSLYLLYSSVRIDADVIEDYGLPGAFARLYWTIPLMTFLHPDIGLALIEAAYEELVKKPNHYKQKTGFEGDVRFRERSGNRIGKIPNSVDVVLTALVGIDAWDYYRTTLDDAWLAGKGMRVLADCADVIVFFYSRGTEEGLVRTLEEETPYFVKDHAFSSGCSVLALEYAIEASRILHSPFGDIRPNAWKTCHREMTEVGFLTERVTRGVLSSSSNFDTGVVPLYRGFDPSQKEEDITDVLALFTPFLERVWKEEEPGGLYASNSKGHDYLYQNENENGRAIPLSPLHVPTFSYSSILTNPNAVLKLGKTNMDYYYYACPCFVKSSAPVENVLRDENENEDEGGGGENATVNPFSVQHPYNIAWRAMNEGWRLRYSGRIPDTIEADKPAVLLEELLESMANDAEDQKKNILLGWTPFVWDRRVGDAYISDTDDLRKSSEAVAAGSVFLETFLTTLCGRRVYGMTGQDGFSYRQFKNDLFKTGNTVLPPGMEGVMMFLRQVGGARVPSAQTAVRNNRTETRSVINNRIYDKF